MISPSQRPLPDNTQHSQQTNIHAPGGIRTYDRSRRAAVDLRLRPRGHWDRRLQSLLYYIADCYSGEGITDLYVNLWCFWYWRGGQLCGNYSAVFRSTASNKLEMMCKEIEEDRIQVPFHHLAGRAEKNHENPNATVCPWHMVKLLLDTTC